MKAFSELCLVSKSLQRDSRNMHIAISLLVWFLLGKGNLCCAGEIHIQILSFLLRRQSPKS